MHEPAHTAAIIPPPPSSSLHPCAALIPAFNQIPTNSLHITSIQYNYTSTVLQSLEREPVDVSLVTEMADMYAWGNGNNGQLGLPADRACKTFMVPQMVVRHQSIRAIACGGDHRQVETAGPFALHCSRSCGAECHHPEHAWVLAAAVCFTVGRSSRG